MTSFNDPIAELLTCMRNAQKAQHVYVDLDLSKMRVSIAELMKKEGFIEEFLVDENMKKMRIFLKYAKGRRPVIHGMKRVSSPGLRRYVGHQNIPLVMNGIGMAVLSTSKGILDDKTAREMKIGGEILCYIW